MSQQSYRYQPATRTVFYASGGVLTAFVADTFWQHGIACGAMMLGAILTTVVFFTCGAAGFHELHRKD